MFCNKTRCNNIFKFVFTLHLFQNSMLHFLLEKLTMNYILNKNVWLIIAILQILFTSITNQMNTQNNM